MPSDGKKIEQIFKESQPIYTNVKKLEIGGFPAMNGNVDYETHSLIYLVQKNGKVVSFIFFTKNFTDERKYFQEIEQFMASVKFK